MRLPDNVFETLKAERAKYGVVPSDVELGRLLNATAWAHRLHGFGVSRKVGGTTVPMPGGGTICRDVLMLEDGTAWDVLVAAGGASTPTQGDSFLITDLARGWLAPVDPGEADEPIPEPIPEPTPSPDPPGDLNAIRYLIARLNDRVTALEQVPIPPPAPLCPPFDPNAYEAAGKFGWWGVTLPLRKKD